MFCCLEKYKSTIAKPAGAKEVIPSKFPSEGLAFFFPEDRANSPVAEVGKLSFRSTHQSEKVW